MKGDERKGCDYRATVSRRATVSTMGDRKGHPYYTRTGLSSAFVV